MDYRIDLDLQAFFEEGPVIYTHLQPQRVGAFVVPAQHDLSDLVRRQSLGLG